MVTTALAPIILPCPIFTFPKITAPAPINTSSAITGACVLRFWLVLLAPSVTFCICSDFGIKVDRTPHFVVHEYCSFIDGYFRCDCISIQLLINYFQQPPPKSAVFQYISGSLQGIPISQRQRYLLFKSFLICVVLISGVLGK